MENQFYTKLREAIKDSGISQAELARKTGVQQASISRFVNEKQGLDAEPAIKLTHFLGGQISFPEKEETPAIRRIAPNAPTEAIEGEGLQELSVYDVAGAGPAIEVSELTPLFSVYAPPDYLRRADYAILVDGHSMEPLIPNRSVVGIKTGVPFVANELYAARIPYEGMVIKRVGVDRAANEFVFKSQNPDKESYPDFRLNINEAEEIIVGRVVWVMWGY